MDQRPRTYLHVQNAHFLLGGLTSDGIRTLESGIAAWDADTGHPSRLIKHNSVSTSPHTRESFVSGIRITDDGFSEFRVVKNSGDGGSILQINLTSDSEAPSCRVEVPLRLALKGARNITKGHTVYLHVVHMKDGKSLSYYGITSRHWLTRLKEHESAARSGSPLLFHRALRAKIPELKGVCSCVIAAGCSKDEAYDAEEYLVEKYSLYPSHVTGLNMIPGGYAGIRWLIKMKADVDLSAEPDARDAALLRVVAAHPRLGAANPAIAMRWADDVYAEAVICGHDNRLSADQVRHIRMLAATGYDTAHIVAAVSAIDAGQVRRVMSGRTYGRIRP